MTMSDNTRNVLFGQGDVNGIITPLIPFNCVYDLDVGIVRFMYENGYTNNSDIMNTEFFQIFKSGNIKLISTLYSRVDENPLRLFIYDNKVADEMYIEFMSKYINDITRSSVHTGIYEIATAFKTEKSIAASIIYSNQTEYDMIKYDRRLAGIQLVSLEDLRDIEDYNLFFFKSLEDMYISMIGPKVKSDSVYIMDYRFNYNEKGTDLKDCPFYAQLEVNRNTINVINAYDRNRLHMEES